MKFKLSAAYPARQRDLAVNGHDRAATTPAAAAKATIGLIDDHPMICAGLAQLINQQADMAVEFEANDLTAALQLARQHQPRLIVLDLKIPGTSGTELLKQLKQLLPAPCVLVLSMHDEAIYAERVLRAGADGYIMKSAGGAALLVALRRVLAGQTYLSDHMWAQLVAGMSDRAGPVHHSPIERLTDREFQVLQLVGEGRNTRAIADQLQISPKTVDVHRGRLRHKLGLPDAAALMRYAVRWTEVVA